MSYGVTNVSRTKVESVSRLSTAKMTTAPSESTMLSTMASTILLLAKSLQVARATLASITSSRACSLSASFLTLVEAIELLTQTTLLTLSSTAAQTTLLQEFRTWKRAGCL